MGLALYVSLQENVMAKTLLPPEWFESYISTLSDEAAGELWDWLAAKVRSRLTLIESIRVSHPFLAIERFGDDVGAAKRKK